MWYGLSVLQQVVQTTRACLPAALVTNRLHGCQAFCVTLPRSMPCCTVDSWRILRMRIAFTSDLHTDHHAANRLVWQTMVTRLQDLAPDVFICCGDVAADEKQF